MLGKYKNNRTNIEVKHIPCGDIYSVHPHDFLNKRTRRCQRCASNEKVLDKFDSFIIENSLEEYTLTNREIIVNQKDKVEFHHYNCNNIFPMTIDRFYAGNRCPYCSNTRTNKNSAQMKIDNKTSKGEFVILNREDEINHNTSKVSLLHTKCGRVTETSLAYFVTQNANCSHCTKEKNARIKRKTHEEFVIELEEMYGDEYEAVDKYITALTYIDVLHKPCGNILSVRPSSLLTMNSGCKHCSMSSPERIIDSLLKESNLEYETQYRFKDCRSKKGISLPFDFVLFDSGNVSLIIEYDGQHHFHEKSFGKESHERTVENDKIKNAYCESKDIKLIRIPYTKLKNLKDIVLNIMDTMK